jgi:predicted negative regulator of RcsB-dependent stress response
MKPKTTTLLATIATLAFTPLISASENQDHDHGSKIEVSIPEKLSDLWKSIEAEHATLSAAIAKQDIPAAHDAEQHLQGFLKAIPAKTSALEESVRARIDGQAKNLSRAYDSLHHASDDKAWDKAKASLTKAESSMKLLAAQISKI